MNDFDRNILKELQDLLETDEMETLVREYTDINKRDSALRIDSLRVAHCAHSVLKDIAVLIEQ